MRMSIEIQPLYELDGGPIMGFYARGHHETAVFTKAMVRFARREGYPCILGGLEANDVIRTWWRMVPWHGGEEMEQQKAEPHSRGAFKVTCWDSS